MSDSESAGADYTGIALTWSERFVKNRGQVFGMLSGLTLIVVGGLNLGWTLFTVDFASGPWVQESIQIEVVLVHIAMFMGAIVGGFNAGYFIDTIGRKNMYFIVCAVYIFAGTMLSLFHVQIVSIFISRILFGYGFGMTYLTILASSGEISTIWNRGMISSLIQLSFIFGIFIFTIINAVYHNDKIINLNRVVAGLSVVIAIVSYLLNYFLGTESPVYLFHREKAAEASAVMKLLRNEQQESRDTRYEYEQMRLMVLEDSVEKSSIFYQKTFYFIIFLKLMATVTFSCQLNYIRIKLSEANVTPFHAHAIQPILLIGVRLLAAIFPIVTMDSFGRRFHVVWPARIATIALLVIGILDIIDTWAVVIFLFIYEAVAGFGLHATADTYATEVFATQKKGIGLSFLICADSLLNLLLTVMATLVDMNHYYYIFVLISAAFISVLGFLEVPETRRLTLREARKRFHRIEFTFKL